MLHWICANLATIFVCAILLLLSGLIVFHLIQNRRKGKTACGCGHCEMSGHCDRCGR
ncbi:FeoB-associated Cys-rich membrane protein [Oscillibacter sp.]|uniref:FeoB-associated Cys-rich membrane protein n=1 Tax=Oscillibacter sp. TaxID=1945593 RepID=UPI002635B256|nr:FeoB-associated Cys-rich membrane protein [Oscillibacter sp.]MDD3347393.1 FeoB-associated Cys-rich membrane protein [Oscillibacter sp.]